VTQQCGGRRSSQHHSTVDHSWQFPLDKLAATNGQQVFGIQATCRGIVARAPLCNAISEPNESEMSGVSLSPQLPNGKTHIRKYAFRRGADAPGKFQPCGTLFAGMH